MILIRGSARAAGIALLMVMAIGIALAASAGGPSFWRAYFGFVAAAHADRVQSLRGGDGASIPVATPEQQGLDAQALESAGATAARVGARALLVARRGHLIRVQTLRGEPDAPVRSTLLSRLVLGAGLAAVMEQRGAADAAALGAVLDWSGREQGSGSARNPWSTRSSVRFGAARSPPLPAGLALLSFTQAVSNALWQPLAAADARYELDSAGRPRLACGLWLRPRDALALAVALQADGQVGGQRLLSAGTAAQVLRGLDDGIAPRGAEAFGARAARVLRDDEGTRAYFFPARELVILLIGADEALLEDETEIAHQVLRGIVDTSTPAVALPALNSLVPSH